MDTWRKRLAALALGTAASVMACGGGAGVPEPLAGLLDAGYAGTERGSPTTGPAAQRAEDVWLVSCGLVAERCAAPAAAFEEAAAELGWSTTVEDDLDASGHSGAIRAAVAAGADGIVLAGVDCALTSDALDEALRAGVPTVAVASVDCDDPAVGRTRRFRAEVNMGPGRETYGRFLRASGATKGAWAVDRLGGSGTVLDVRLEGALSSQLVSEGFTETVERCRGCRVVDVELPVASLLSGSFPARLAAALGEHPDASVVHLPDDETARLAAEVLADRQDLAVIGGEGLPGTLDRIRSGGGQDAALAVSSEWLGWAAADTLNRVLAGEAAIPDSGIGWTLVDEGHALPAAATDFRTALRRIWRGSSTGAA